MKATSRAKKKPATKRKSTSSPYVSVEQVRVYVWGTFVGAVARDASTGYNVFAYDKAFGRRGVELAPITMPSNADERLFVFPSLSEATYRRLPAMLADALPDDFGNALIDRYLAEKGIGRDEITALDRLAYMGSRGMGALEFRPAKGPKRERATAIDMNELVVEARAVVSGHVGTDDEKNGALRHLIDVGTSAGGARAKAVIAWNEKTNEIRSGQVDAPPGFEQWLLKFDGIGRDRELGPSSGYGRIEYAYYLMAKEAGIDMMPSRLLEENGRAHFFTKRFDRTGANTKHHVQTLCAMNHVDFRLIAANGYEQLFLCIKRLQLGQKAIDEAFRRMVFNIVGKNCDDHSKNFAFVLAEGSHWKLAPAYDISFAHNPKGQWTKQHLMSVDGEFRNIELDHVLAVAKRFGVRSPKAKIDDVEAVFQDWRRHADSAGVPEGAIDRIAAFHRRLK